MLRGFIGLILLTVASVASATVNVVATTSGMGMLARAIGGDAVQVTVLAPPDRDAHFLQARPSMMAALRRADLVVAVGAELEVGWLPAALQGAGNPRVNPGQPGYFEAAAQVALIDVGGPADRALGDVHPAGNPHVNMDPVRMIAVAEALAGRLGTLDRANADVYGERARTFAEQVEARLPRWREEVEGAAGVVLYHKDANYLLQLLDVPILGYVEAIPGIPPTARQLRSLIENLRGRSGIVLQADYQPDRGARFVARELEWEQRALPIEPPLASDTEAWLSLIDRWVEAIATTRQ